MQTRGSNIFRVCIALFGFSIRKKRIHKKTNKMSHNWSSGTPDSGGTRNFFCGGHQGGKMQFWGASRGQSLQLGGGTNAPHAPSPLDAATDSLDSSWRRDLEKIVQHFNLGSGGRGMCKQSISLIFITH